MNEFNMYEREIESRLRGQRLLEGAVRPRVRRPGGRSALPGSIRRRTTHGLHRRADAVER
ncbi:MAG: hypothetical protein M3Y66_02550 [Actinomycetota bacterium]|nr:hypothetical protein [Actinomycetota bacterium]